MLLFNIYFIYQLQWAGWPNGETVITCVQIWPGSNWMQVIVSCHKHMQAMAKQNQELSQVFNVQ